MAPGPPWPCTPTARSACPFICRIRSMLCNNLCRFAPCFCFVFVLFLLARRYGVPKGLYFSFPVTCTPGSYSIVKGLTVDKFSQEVSCSLHRKSQRRTPCFTLRGVATGAPHTSVLQNIDKTTKELLEERDAVRHLTFSRICMDFSLLHLHVLCTAVSASRC